MFTPKIGEDFHFDSYFSKGLNPPTSSHLPKSSRRFFFGVFFFGTAVLIWRCLPIVDWNFNGQFVAGQIFHQTSAEATQQTVVLCAGWLCTIVNHRQTNHHLGDYLLLFPSIEHANLSKRLRLPWNCGWNKSLLNYWSFAVQDHWGMWATKKKHSYFPLDPACLIGILIMTYNGLL